MSRKRPIEYKVIVVFLIALAALCGVCVGRHVYSHLHTQCIERQQNAQVEQRIEEAQKFLEEIERTGNLYHVFSRIAGTIDDGKVTNGYCKAWRMLGGNLMWPSPENHMLAAYWDQKDSERDGQFRSESAQYVASSWLTNGIQHVWANRDKLVVCVDSIIGNNTKIADELMRSKEIFTYYSVGMPKIDFAALANVVRCYWCARIVRHAERGRVRMAEGELKRMIELAALVVKGANTDEEIHLAVVMLRNAQECIRAIMPLLGGELDRMRIWLSDFDNLQPKIASRELEEALHENAKLRLEVSQEWDRRIGRDRP